MLVEMSIHSKNSKVVISTKIADETLASLWKNRDLGGIWNGLPLHLRFSCQREMIAKIEWKEFTLVMRKSVNSKTLRAKQGPKLERCVQKEYKKSFCQVRP